jgi:hypothetical protein
VLGVDGVTWEASTLRDADGNRSRRSRTRTLSTYVFPGVGTRAGGRLRCTVRTSGSSVVSMVATDHPLFFQPPEPIAVPADAEANTSKLRRVVTRLTGYNGATFDMLRSGLAGFASGVLATPTGAQQALTLAGFRALNVVLTDGQFTHLQTLANGILKVADQYLLAGENGPEANLAVTPNPVGSSTNALTNVVSTALENSRVLIAAAGKLYAFDGAHHTASLSGSVLMTANNNAFQATFDGLRAVGITISGTWTGTLAFEGSADGGTTWDSIGVQTSAGGPAGAVVTTTTANGAWFLASTQAGAYTLIRAKSTGTVGTGTATVQLHSVSLILYLQFFNTTSVPADTAVPFDVMPISCFEPVPLKSVMAFFGRYQSTGGCFALSTTAATKTIANGAGGFFDTGLRAA